MWLLPRLRLAFARRPWSYWLLVLAAVTVTWWRIAALHDDAQRERDAWGTSADVWVARADVAAGDAIEAERRDLPTALVPTAALHEVEVGALAARDLAAGEVLVPADVVDRDTAPADWVVVAVEARSPRLATGDPVSVFQAGRPLCDGVAEGGATDGVVELAVPPACAAALSLATATGDVVVGRRS